MQDEIKFAITLVSSILTSSLAATGVTWYSAWRQQRTEVSINLVRAFFTSVYSELECVNTLLEKDSSSWSITQENLVRKTRDWFETISTLCNKKVANIKIIKSVGIDSQICDFYQNTANAKKLTDIRKLWQEMKQFCKNR